MARFVDHDHDADQDQQPQYVFDNCHITSGRNGAHRARGYQFARERSRFAVNLQDIANRPRIPHRRLRQRFPHHFVNAWNGIFPCKKAPTAISSAAFKVQVAEPPAS